MMEQYKATNFYDSIKILNRLEKFGKSNLKDVLSNESLQSNDVQNVIDLCLDCNVIYVDNENNLILKICSNSHY